MKQYKQRMKRFFYQCTALVLSLMMLAPMTAFAADDANNGMVPVTYDESLYVTLDHYGNRENVSIVKGVDLNGNQSFTDFGSYAKVQNMSGYEKPEITPDGAVWDLKEYQKNRIYFECTPKDDSAVALPWKFKVSYKLNGVPTKAEDLAGKSGMVEMIAECEANPDVSDYMKNNMLLQLVTLVDTEKVLSIEAEGAQTQSLGKYKAVIFAGLPGESRTFSIRIGTEHFSSLGLIMMIEPATLAQMEQLKELREAKDTIGDAPAVLLNGMSSMLQSVSGIADGMGETGKGIDDLKKAYANAQDYSGDILTSSAEMAAAFSGLSGDISGFLPYIDSTSRQVEEMKKLLASLMEKTAGDPAKMSGAQLQEKLTAAAPELEKLNVIADNLASEATKLQAGAGTVSRNTAKQEAVAGEGAALAAASNELTGMIDGLTASPKAIGDQLGDIQKILDALKDLAEVAQSPELLAAMKNLLSTFESMLNQAGQAGTKLIGISQSAATLMSALTGAISASGSDLSTGVKKVLDGLSNTTASTSGLSDASAQMQGVGNTLQTAIDKVLNQFTEGNNLLNIDTNAKRQSMTSEKNGAPTSVQMILRTETIGVTLAEEPGEKKDEKTQTPWGRIQLVFEKIWKAITTLFE